jgi:hypothetical protein
MSGKTAKSSPRSRDPYERRIIAASPEFPLEFASSESSIDATKKPSSYCAFNAAEELWRRLEVKRLRRRELCPDLAPELQFQLDLLDFANARSPEDCIGLVVDP